MVLRLVAYTLVVPKSAYDDYMHFNHALFSTTVEKKTRPIKLEVHMRFVMQHTMFVKNLDNVCLDLKN